MNNDPNKELLSKMRSVKQKNANTDPATDNSWIKEESELAQNQFDPEKIAQDSKANDPLLGKVLFGTYKIECILGEGAMGIVYKAKQLAFDRFVALKTIKTEDPAISNRFAQEVKVHAQLKHENIVEAIDCLVAPNNQTFFVMEYLQGIELEDLVRTNELVGKPLELANIIKQIGQALDFAHEKGVVHRDLKPGNIVLLEKEGELLVKVVDFGIAKVQEDIQRLTKTGQALGSPLYMSPEQCMGEKIDGRSDIYSLGVLLYECATGSIPFQGPNLVETMKLHCDPDIHPPKVNSIVSDFPGGEQFDSIILKALSFFPDNRFQTCHEFNQALNFWIKSINNNTPNTPVPGTSRRIGKATRLPTQEQSYKDSKPSQPKESVAPTPKPIAQPGMPSSKKSSSFAPAIILGVIVGLVIMVSILVTALFFMKEKVNELKTPGSVSTDKIIETSSPAVQPKQATSPVESQPATTNGNIVQPAKQVQKKPIQKIKKPKKLITKRKTNRAKVRTVPKKKPRPKPASKSKSTDRFKDLFNDKI